MVLQRRNTTQFQYYPHYDEGGDLNEYGEHTGVYDEPVHAEPVTYLGNISIPSGNTVHQFYGEEIRYTHTLLMDKPDVPIDEYGMISWQGHLYDIIAVRRSLNVLSAALRRRTDEQSESGDDDESGD